MDYIEPVSPDELPEEYQSSLSIGTDPIHVYSDPDFGEFQDLLIPNGIEPVRVNAPLCLFDGEIKRAINRRFTSKEEFVRHCILAKEKLPELHRLVVGLYKVFDGFVDIKKPDSDEIEKSYSLLVRFWTAARRIAPVERLADEINDA